MYAQCTTRYFIMLGEVRQVKFDMLEWINLLTYNLGLYINVVYFRFQSGYAVYMVFEKNINYL